MLEREIAPGIQRIEDAYTNWYLVEGGHALTIVDAGVPTCWRSFEDALRTLGRSPGCRASTRTNAGASGTS